MSRVVEHMDFVHDGASLVTKQEEEDRISKLPDDIILHILGFLDMKYAVQFCTLSQKWKHIWTTMPNLNLSSQLFRTKPQFKNFVKNALTRRNINTKVSAVQLTITGVVAVASVTRIIKYAYSHNVIEMNILGFARDFKLPYYLFSSLTLKHLTLASVQLHFIPFGTGYIPEFPWDFPALETLILKDSGIQYGFSGRGKNLNLFSKCPKLKDLTLHNFSFFGVKIFNICAPQLINLTITNTSVFPDVLNVVAPKLQNLTASINSENERPFSHVLHFSEESFSSLERVNLSWFMTRFGRYKKESCVTGLHDLFQKLHSAKNFIIDMDIIEILSSALDKLSREPCPFDNLKSVKIDTALIETTFLQILQVPLSLWIIVRCHRKDQGNT